MTVEFNKANSDYEVEILCVQRVTTVAEGGRRFSFLVMVVVGNKSGVIGIGKGKAQEIPDATAKATQDAKKNLFKVPLKQARTIHHEVRAKAGGCILIMKPAPAGKGNISGGAVRVIVDMVGMHDIVIKILGSRNVHNQVNALVKALKHGLSSPKEVAKRRKIPINELIAKREVGLNNKKKKLDQGEE